MIALRKDAKIKKEGKKGENWRKGYQAGIREGREEGIKACGNCRFCYGKGYLTSISGGKRRILPCACERGKQFAEILESVRNEK